MTRVNQHVLIIDNATTCSMRLKVLIQIHGVMASIVHWSDWEEDAPRFFNEPNCMVIVEQTVPNFVVQSVVRQLPDLPFFLLFDGQPIEPDWEIDKQINPISNTLSNFELISLLEPYWSEEKEISLPTTLVLDDSPNLSFKISQTLADANVPCRISNNVSITQIKDIDLVMVNIADYDKRTKQLDKINKALPNISVIAYGTKEQVTALNFVQFALHHQIADVMTLEELDNNWLNKFYRAWRVSAEIIDKSLVNQHIQKSLDHLLEKNLVLKVLFETSLDGVVSFDSAGHIMKFNGGFAELLGTCSEKLTGAQLFERLSPQSRIELNDILSSSHLIQQQVLDLQLLHAHDVSIPVSVAINRINFHGESVYVAVMRNNTNQQLQTKLLVQRNSQLEYQAKEAESKCKEIRETSRKTGRNKNAFMVAFTEYLSKHDNIGDAAVKHKIDNVNLYFRIKSGSESYRPVSSLLSDSIKAVLHEHSEAIKQAGIAVKASMMDLQKVSFVTEHLKAVLSEIVTNAVKFSPQGGVLEIKQYVISSQSIELRISDTGKGILDHLHAHIFDMYETNSTGSQDFRTGLPLVKNLMTLNKGDIYVENNKLEGDVVGTSFVLTLPLESS